MFAAACESSQPSTQLLLELPSLFLLSSKHGYVTFAYGEDWYWFFFFFNISSWKFCYLFQDEDQAIFAVISQL